METDMSDMIGLGPDMSDVIDLGPDIESYWTL